MKTSPSRFSRGRVSRGHVRLGLAASLPFPSESLLEHRSPSSRQHIWEGAGPALGPEPPGLRRSPRTPPIRLISAPPPVRLGTEIALLPTEAGLVVGPELNYCVCGAWMGLIPVIRLADLIRELLQG